MAKVFVHSVSVLFILIVVQCSKVLDRVCNACNLIVFNVEQGLQDRILEDGRELKSKIVKSDTECFVECSVDCRCMSFSVCGDSCRLNAGSRNLVRNALRHKPGCRYYDFPAFKSTCDPLPSPPAICCLPSSPLCFNGGTCVVNVTDTTRRFKCHCATGYYGNQCQVQKPRTCLDYWSDKVKPISGEYTIVDSTGRSYQVFCDFDSEAGIAWTLFESFDIAHETELSTKTFAVDFPLNEHHLNWQLFRLPKYVMTYISSHSTFWRATCSYAKYGVAQDFRDYIRMRLSIMNPLNFTGYFSSANNPCLPVDYFDIKGKNCVGCTQSFFQSTGIALHLKPKNSRVVRKCSFDSSSAEYVCRDKQGYYAHILGLYLNNCPDPEVRCSENVNSTTEFWFGAKRKV